MSEVLKAKVVSGLASHNVDVQGGYDDPHEDEFGLATSFGMIEYSCGSWSISHGGESHVLGSVEWSEAVRLFVKNLVE